MSRPVRNHGIPIGKCSSFVSDVVARGAGVGPRGPAQPGGRGRGPRGRRGRSPVGRSEASITVVELASIRLKLPQLLVIFVSALPMRPLLPSAGPAGNRTPSRVDGMFTTRPLWSLSIPEREITQLRYV